MNPPSLIIINDILKRSADREYVHRALMRLGLPTIIANFIKSEDFMPSTLRATQMGCLPFIQFILPKLSEKDKLDCISIAAEYDRVAIFHFLLPLVDLRENAEEIAHLTIPRDNYNIFNQLLCDRLLILNDEILNRAIDHNSVEIVAKILERDAFLDYAPFLERARSQREDEKNHIIRFMLREKIEEKCSN